MEIALRIGAIFVGLYVVFAGFAHMLSRVQSAGGRSILEAPGQAVSARSAAFDRSGTVTYFREGTGHLNAYLVYGNGHSTSTKILNFSSRSLCTYAAQERCPRSAASLRAHVGNGPIRVIGATQNEELYVELIGRLPSLSQAVE